jgi:hypothetical protein
VTSEVTGSFEDDGTAGFSEADMASSEKPPISDSAAAAVGALGVVLLIAGAFYSRVRKLSGAGVSVEIGDAAGNAAVVTAPPGSTPQKVAEVQRVLSDRLKADPNAAGTVRSGQHVSIASHTWSQTSPS